jgi:molecular chaperone GrpE
MQEFEKGIAANAAGEDAPESPVAETKVEETAPSLEEMLRQAELKAEEHHDAWLRAKAETENVRRRAQEDIVKASKFAIERFAGELLAVKDSLEAALAAENPSVESLRAGSELTLKQLAAAFEKSGLREIDPAGERFDPNFHQAISMIESEREAGTVVTVLQKGYLIAERVLRPALVVVARPKEEPPA